MDMLPYLFNQKANTEVYTADKAFREEIHE
jgi:hypothetical protein